MAAAAEDDRGRLEAEVVATAQLATAVEARLRGALAAKDAAESCVAAAELRAHQARISAALKARLTAWHGPRSRCCNYFRQCGI